LPIILCGQFDLNKYARPDFERYSLDATPFFAGSIGKQSNSNSSFRNVRLNGDLIYTAVKNSRKWQQFNRIELTPDLSFSEDGSRISLRTDFDVDTRYFLKPRRYLAFYAGGNVASTLYQNRLASEPKSSVAISSINDFGVGFGRMESLRDVVHISRIFDLLKQDGVLLKELTEEDLFAITDTVALLKNKRFFDFRLQRIRELESLLNVLYEMGYIANDDFRTAVILADAYDYEQVSQLFETGQSMEFLIGRDMQYSDQGGFFSSDDLRLTLSFLKSKVNGKYWLGRYSASTKLRYRRADDVSGGQDRYIVNIGLGYQWRYTPTNRVVFNWNNRIDYDYDLRKRTLSDDIKSQGLSVRSTYNISYYVSPEIRLSGIVSGDLGYDSNQLGNTETSSHFYRLSFSARALYSFY